MPVVCVVGLGLFERGFPQVWLYEVLTISEKDSYYIKSVNIFHVALICIGWKMCGDWTANANFIGFRPTSNVFIKQCHISDRCCITKTADLTF